MHDTQAYQSSFACVFSSKKLCLEDDVALEVAPSCGGPIGEIKRLENWKDLNRPGAVGPNTWNLLQVFGIINGHFRNLARLEVPTIYTAWYGTVSPQKDPEIPIDSLGEKCWKIGHKILGCLICWPLHSKSQWIRRAWRCRSFECRPFLITI